MRSTLKILSLIILFWTMASQTMVHALDFPVEVVEIKDIGISAEDDSKSIIEIRWRINSALVVNVASFNLILSVTYADGTTINAKRQSDGKSSAMRVEVPSVNISKGRPAASIKKMNAMVTAVIPNK